MATADESISQSMGVNLMFVLNLFPNPSEINARVEFDGCAIMVHRLDKVVDLILSDELVEGYCPSIQPDEALELLQNHSNSLTVTFCEDGHEHIISTICLMTAYWNFELAGRWLIQNEGEIA